MKYTDDWIQRSGIELIHLKNRNKIKIYSWGDLTKEIENGYGFDNDTGGIIAFNLIRSGIMKDIKALEEKLDGDIVKRSDLKSYVFKE